MRILLTNDDGLSSKNLMYLYDRLASDHDVWVVAPEAERSGCSHSITLRDSIKFNQVSDRIFSCSGTPADCVILSVLGMIDSEIELVISGPNLGFNLGTDIVYSGTAAAARQAVIMGLPAVATSLPFNSSESSLHRAGEFIAKNLAVFKELSSPDHFLNINFPELDSKPLELVVTFPSLRIYNDRLDTRKESDGTIYCKIDGPPPVTRGEQGSDYDAIASGRISMSPVSIHPNNHKIENRYETSVIWTGEEG